MQSMTRYHETLDAYRQAVRRLHVLQNRSPFPNAENLEKSRSSQSNTSQDWNPCAPSWPRCRCRSTPASSRKNFRMIFAQRSTGSWKKRRRQVSSCRRAFILVSANMPTAFPTNTPRLLWRDNSWIIEKIVTNLIDFKVQSIDSLNRLPLPEESTPSPRKTEEPQKGVVGSRRVLGAFPSIWPSPRSTASCASHSTPCSIPISSLSFAISPFRIRRASDRRFPAKAAAEASLCSRDDSAAPVSSLRRSDPAPTTRPRQLNVILGRELVKASLRIEIIDFPIPPSAEK